MASIMVVEDDKALSDLLHSHLVAEGHSVIQIYDGPSALAAIEQHALDLIILDWMLPGLDGLTVCRRIRQQYLTPIIMLTARNEEVDQILGLEVGADDYITKPFSIRQVMARVRASLRRVELERLRTPTVNQNSRDSAPTESESSSDVLIRGSLEIYLAQRLVQVQGHAIDLTPKEYDLLILLASHPGWVFKREIIVQQVWGDDYEGFDRTIDNHITRLRKKLGEAGDKIDTVWGVGYRFISS
jgi:DNA-binding response OmpR family regulator